jgi:hypothetical protein
MNTNDLVSVVIPVFNSGKFLQESLESVINQTYKNIEIICVDDGSTDESPEILKQYSNKISIITQKNSGLAHALNTGINAMHGKWFKWFSPDDIMYPEMIAILVNTSTSFNYNVILYSNWNMINETGKKIRSFVESNYNHLDIFDFNVRLLDGQQINVNTTLISNSLFSKGLRMNTLIDPVLVDYDFFLRAGLLYQTKFHLIEKQLIKFRIHKNQLSHQNVLKSLENLEKIKVQILSELDTELQDQYLKNLIIYQKHQPISKKFIKTGLKLISTILPNTLTNDILLFYINKIRRSR